MAVGRCTRSSLRTRSDQQVFSAAFIESVRAVGIRRRELRAIRLHAGDRSSRA